MSAPRCCDWCDVEMPNGALINADHGDFCSQDCEQDAECEIAEEEYDGQPSEMDEWLSFDPDC